MIHHESFFDALATAEKESPEWQTAVAGIVILRLVDAAVEDIRLVHADWGMRRAVRDAVESLPEVSSARAILSRVVDEIDRAAPDWKAIVAALVHFGRALDFDGRWALAVTVFETASQIATGNGAWSLAVEANIALGGSARRAGNWKKSNSGYAEALYLGEGLGDVASSLTARIGIANNQMARGNLPEANRLLASIVAEADAGGFHEVASDALHSLASLMHRRGNAGDAIATAYEALQKATNATRKDTILADIAAYFAELGNHEAARDAHMIVAATSQYQWLRWQAMINLMELASMSSAEAEFDRYATELTTAALPQNLKAYFLLYSGIGCLRFGREDEGRRNLEEAEAFASAAGINQVAFEARNALSRFAELMRAPSTSPEVQVEGALPNTQNIARSLSHLREVALSSTQPA